MNVFKIIGLILVILIMIDQFFFDGLHLYTYITRPKWQLKQVEGPLINSLDLENKKVLDFACGTGNATCLLGKSDYIGCDISSKSLNFARQKNPTKNFVQIDLIKKQGDRLPFETGTFDYIYLSCCLHHIPTHEINLIFAEFYRILKPDGQILGCEPYMTEHSSMSNWTCNLIDDGDYIRTIVQYKDLFKSSYDFKEKYHKDLFLYKMFVYVCQKKPQIDQPNIQNVSDDKSSYREKILPIRDFFKNILLKFKGHDNQRS